MSDENTLSAVYHRYRHLDPILSESKGLRTMEWLTISDMWSAIKSAHLEREALIDSQRCRHPNIEIADGGMHCPECGNTWSRVAFVAQEYDDGDPGDDSGGAGRWQHDE